MFEAAQARGQNAEAGQVELEEQLQTLRTEVDKLRVSSWQQAEVSSQTCCLNTPRSSFNDVAVRDCQLRRITKPYKDAQNRLLWRDKTCLART